MIQATYKKKGIRITQLWYPGTENEYKGKTDILFWHGVEKRGSEKNRIYITFHTQMSDLTLSEEELLEKINKTERYQIRKSGRDNVELRTFSSSELKNNPQVMEQFTHMYAQMYEEKGMHQEINRNQMNAYLNAGAIYLTGIYEGETPHVFHSYIVDEKNARLLHSTSNFRSSEENASFVARSNKRLHWEDMLLFKRLGIERYDWGGISNVENPNGIDIFKMKFGGEIITYYNVYEGYSPIGKIAVNALKHRKEQ